MYLNKPLFEEFLEHKEILWVGINFGKSKFTRKGFDLNQENLQKLLHEWNILILNDQKKYDIRMSFRKPIMQYDLSYTTKINKSLKHNHILAKRIYISNVYSDEQICEYANAINYPTSLPFALSFIVESFDSFSKTASIWVVIVKTETNEVVLCEKFLKIPSGLGTRNYWARTFYNVFYDIQNNAFLRWVNMVSDGEN